MPDSEIMKIRRNVLSSALKSSRNENDPTERARLSKEIISDGSPRYRCCIHKERAIVEERLKLIFEPEKGPVVRVLAEACNGCEMHRYVVTDGCQNCTGHFCASNCPKKAIPFLNGHAFIDQSKCVECGLCAKNCPFRAIIELRRPCEEGCPMKAISVGKDRVASIDQQKCTSCGFCVANCPFGAVVDASDLVTLDKTIHSRKYPVYAVLAPAFVGQFGRQVAPGQVKAGLLKLGFTDVWEAALGADSAITLEAEEYAERAHKGEKLMTSSCCPAYVAAVHQQKNDLTRYISSTTSPMVQVATLIKSQDPRAKVTFIGPCIAKKAEGRQVGSGVDYVITFEELIVWFEYAGIHLSDEQTLSMNGPSSFARSFAKAGGVANALQNFMGEKAPPIYRIEGISNCLKTLEQYAGKDESGFVECMACEGGCVGGPRTLIRRSLAERAVDEFAKSSNEQ